MIKKFFNKLLNTNPKNAIAFDQSMNLVGMPIVTLSQGDKRFNFILDTGSTICVVNKEDLKHINHRLVNTKYDHHGIEGQPHECPACKITLSYKDKDYDFEYVISDMRKAFSSIKEKTGVTLHGLLGSNFFEKYRYTIDFNELIAYSKA